LGKENVTRIYPGDLKMVEPNSWTGVWIMWETIYNYAWNPGFAAAIVRQFLLMVWCTAYTAAEKGDQGTPWNAMYCYDNVFADLSLNGGNPGMTNINRYVDTFTWEGLLEVWAFYAIGQVWYEFYWNTVVAIVLALVFLAMPTLPLCNTGEKQLIIGFGEVVFDMCTVLNW
jgi:hypothetical protein